MAGYWYCTKCGSVMDEINGCKCELPYERRPLFPALDPTKHWVSLNISNSKVTYKPSIYADNTPAPNCLVCRVVGKSNCLEHGRQWDLNQLFLP